MFGLCMRPVSVQQEKEAKIYYRREMDIAAIQQEGKRKEGGREKGNLTKGEEKGSICQSYTQKFGKSNKNCDMCQNCVFLT